MFKVNKSGIPLVSLENILSITRKHDSKGETEFIDNYLLPVIYSLSSVDTMETDDIDNVWATVGDPAEHPFLFVSHIDTCHRVDMQWLGFDTREGLLVLDNDSRDSGCLGADDGVGIYSNLRMMEAGVKGTYLFTRGEECGLIGATYLAKHSADKLKEFSLCVEVDRAGKDEIITEQLSGKCASNTFAKALADELCMGHYPSPHGVYTDNSEFNAFIPECVNLAAGYERQHSPNESVDPVYVEELVSKLIKVDWSSLPIERKVDDLGETYDIDWQNHYYGSTSDKSYKHKDSQDMVFDDYEELVTNNIHKVAWFLMQIGADYQEIDGHWQFLDIGETI